MIQVAVGIIIRDGRVLACQRKRDGAYPLKWEFPGGKLEAGETPETAVARELREELKIDSVVEQRFYTQEWTYSDETTGQGKNGAFQVFYFLIRAFTGRPVNLAFEQIRWVTPQELENMDILEGNRKAVELLASNAKKNPQKQTA